MNSKMGVVSASFTPSMKHVDTEPVYQFDHGQELEISGINIDNVQQVHFSNSDSGNAMNMLTSSRSNAIVATIPDYFLTQEEDIWAYIYYEDDLSGRTIKTVRIPVVPRSKPEKVTLDSPIMGSVSQIAGELRALINDVESLRSETIEATDAATLSANNAAESATKSAESAATAAANAQVAANRLNNISFEISLDDGCLYVQMP